MKTIIVATIALSGMLGFVNGAHADRFDNPSGELCNFSSVSDPTPIQNPDTFYGEIDGGPLVLADTPADFSPTVVDTEDQTVTAGTVTVDPADAADNPVSGTLTCAIQVGGTGAYSDPDAVRASASGTGVVYLTPAPITYRATVLDNLYVTTTVCTTDGRGVTGCLYYDYPTQTWVADESQAHSSVFIPPEAISTCAEPIVCVE